MSVEKPRASSVGCALRVSLALPSPKGSELWRLGRQGRGSNGLEVGWKFLEPPKVWSFVIKGGVGNGLKKMISFLLLLIAWLGV